MPRRKLDRVADTFIWYFLPQPLLNHSNKFMKHMPTMHWGLVHQHQLQPCNFLMWTYDRTGESIMLATVFIGVNQFMWEVIYSTVIEWFSQSAKGLIRERGSCNPVVTVCEIGYEWEQSMWFSPSSCQYEFIVEKNRSHIRASTSKGFHARLKDMVDFMVFKAQAHATFSRRDWLLNEVV